LTHARRNFVLFGSFGGANIGDEVILEADLVLARDAGYPQDLGVLTLAATSARQMAQYRAAGLEPVYFKNLGPALRLLWGRYLIIGGGQVLDGSFGPKLALVQMGFALWTRLGGGRLRIGGAGAFHLDGIATRTLYRALFAFCNDMSSRDPTVQFSGAARREARLAADAVFALQDRLTPPADPSPRRRMALAVHQATHVQFMALDETVTLLRQLRAVSGQPVDILVGNTRPDFDLDFAHRLAKAVGPDTDGALCPVVVFETVTDCLNYYRDLRVVLAKRMHPLIIGALSGCVCVPLTGSSKVAEFAQLAGLTCYDIGQAQAIGQAIEVGQPIDPARLADLASRARSLMTAS
jgi:polysaccharide pyruvyl transferase WcaK-like protein